MTRRIIINVEEVDFKDVMYELQELSFEYEFDYHEDGMIK